ncbi:MAG: hypothetical protein AAGG07_12120 [Planctomycetota bacterium]
MQYNVFSKALVAGAFVMAAGSASGASWYASSVIEYDAGDAASSAFNDPNSALGVPTSFSNASFGSFPTTGFQAAAGTSELVTVGRGGSLTLGFDRVIRDDASNPFGIDLIVYGNAFYVASSFGDPSSTVTGVFAEGGTIELSADGNTWVTVSGVEADGGFATLGYADAIDPFGSTPGSVLSDFRTPVDPGFDPIGKTYAELLAGYAGGAGGTGIDLAWVGLSEARFIRITNAIDALGTPEIDGVAIVPAPPAILALCGGLATLRRRR